MSEETPFSLTVNGNAEIPLFAERAIVNVVVSSDGLSKADVSNEIISAAKHIEIMLRKLSAEENTPAAKAAAPVAHWSKTSLSATSYVPARREHEEEQPRRYRGNIKFDIRFREFKAMGTFMTTISSVPHVEVNSVNWALTDETEAKYKSQLRKDAAKDAMVKARDYCDVLGCSNLRPVELNEHHSFSRVGARYAQPCAFATCGADEEEEEEEELNETGLEFTPQEVKITMEISIKFHADAASKSA